MAWLGNMRKQDAQWAGAQGLVKPLERPPCRIFPRRLRARYLRSCSHFGILCDRSSPWSRRHAGVRLSALPQPESAGEGIVVVAGARTGRQPAELFDVASTDDGIIGFACGH